MSNKKLPEITMQDWLDAEAKTIMELTQRPPGSITSREFMENHPNKMGISTAQRKLNQMVEAGLATREQKGNTAYYVLKKSE